VWKVSGWRSQVTDVMEKGLRERKKNNYEPRPLLLPTKPQQKKAW